MADPASDFATAEHARAYQGPGRSARFRLEEPEQVPRPDRRFRHGQPDALSRGGWQRLSLRDRLADPPRPGEPANRRPHGRRFRVLGALRFRSTRKDAGRNEAIAGAAGAFTEHARDCRAYPWPMTGNRGWNILARRGARGGRPAMRRYGASLVSSPHRV